MKTGSFRQRHRNIPLSSLSPFYPHPPLCRDPSPSPTVPVGPSLRPIPIDPHDLPISIFGYQFIKRHLLDTLITCSPLPFPFFLSMSACFRRMTMFVMRISSISDALCLLVFFSSSCLISRLISFRLVSRFYSLVSILAYVL